MLRKTYQTVVLCTKASSLHSLQNSKRFIFSKNVAQSKLTGRQVVFVQSRNYNSQSDKEAEASQSEVELTEEVPIEAELFEKAEQLELLEKSEIDAEKRAKRPERERREKSGVSANDEEEMFESLEAADLLDRALERADMTATDFDFIDRPNFAETENIEERSKVYRNYLVEGQMDQWVEKTEEAQEAFIKLQEIKQIENRESLIREKAKTLKKLQGYEESEKILKAIQEKLNASGTQEQAIEMREYLQSKLSVLDNSYGKYLNSQLSNRSLTDQQAEERQFTHVLGDINRQEAESNRLYSKMVDFRTTGQQNNYGPRQFMPANPFDATLRHHYRQIMTLKEYTDLHNEIVVSNEIYLTDAEDHIFPGKVGADIKYQPLPDGSGKEWDVESPTYKEFPNFNALEQAFRQSIEIAQTPKEMSISKKERENIEEFIRKYKPESEVADTIAFVLDFHTLDKEEQQRLEQVFGLTREEVEAKERLYSALFEQEEYGENAFPKVTWLTYLDFGLRQVLRDRFGTQSPEYEGQIWMDAGRDVTGERAARLVDHAKGPMFDEVGVQHAFASKEKFGEMNAYEDPNLLRVRNANGENDAFSKMQKTLSYEFSEAKRLESEIQLLRQEIAENLEYARFNYKNATEDYLTFVKNEANDYAATMSHQVGAAAPIFDFIGFSKQTQTAFFENAIKKELHELKNKDYVFDPLSKDAEMFEKELNISSKIALLLRKKDKKKALEQFEYVLQSMAEANVKQTVPIQGHVFEFAVLAGQYEVANDLLQKLTKDYSQNFSPVDPRYLELYYRRCLQNNKLEGVGHLVNYCDRYDVDVKKWEIEKFRSALNFFLNDKFDLSKVCIFNKFYAKYFTSVYKDAKSRNVESEKLGREIFGQAADLVDMKGLLQYLVSHLKEETLYDPLTKEDALWKMISFFTQTPEFYQASLNSKTNRVEAQTLADYFGYHLKEPQACNRLLQVLIAVDHTSQSNKFCKFILAKLRDHQLKHRKLPAGFTKTKLKDFYKNLKASGKDLSPEASEVLLTLFKATGLTAEIFDLTKSSRIAKTDLKTYYQSEAILNHPLKSGTKYQNALVKIDPNFLNKKSAVHIIQTTKTLFLDEGPDKALEFFNTQLNDRKSTNQKRDDCFVEIFDQMYAKDKTLLHPSKMSLEEFKTHFQTHVEQKMKVQQQLFAIKQLTSILEEKDIEQVERIFQYYLCLKEEMQIMGVEHILDRSKITTTQIGNNEITEEQQERLDDLESRRDALEVLMHHKDVRSLTELAIVLKDQKLNLGGRTLDYIMAMVDNPELDEEVIDAEEYLQFEEDEKMEALEKLKPEMNFEDERDAERYLEDIWDEHEGLRQENFDAQEVFELQHKLMWEETQQALSLNMNQLRKQLGSNNIDPNLENYIYGDEIVPNFPWIRTDERFEKAFDDADEPLEELTEEDEQLRQELKMSHKEFLIHKSKKALEFIEDQSDWEDMVDNFRDGYDRDTLTYAQEKYEKDLEQKEAGVEGLRQYSKYVDKQRKEIKEALPQVNEVLEHNKNPFKEVYKNMGLKLEDGKPVLDVVDVPIEEVGDPFDENVFFDQMWNDNRLEQKVGKMRRSEHNGTRIGYEKGQRQILTSFRDRMIYDPYLIKDDESFFDPYGIVAEAHETTVFDLEDQLLEAYKQRKQDVIPIALQIFNKLQDLKLSTYKVGQYEKVPQSDQEYSSDGQSEEIIDAYEKAEEGEELEFKERPEQEGEESATDPEAEETFTRKDFKRIQDIKGNLEKFDLLLNDARSPIISSIKDTQKYQTNPFADTFDDHYDVDAIHKVVDVDKILNDKNKLEKLRDEVIQITENLDYIQKQMKLRKDEIYEEMLEKEEDKLDDAEEEFDEKCQELYEEFQDYYEGDDEQITREQKIKFVKAALRLEHGSNFIGESVGQQTTIPSFYALDLIHFGLKNKIPDAVRLGERVLSEDNTLQSAMPRELAMQVKNFILEDTNNYYGATMARQGPMSSSHLYFESRMDSEGKPPIFSLNDPYWREHMQRNTKKGDHWRNPSIYAWDHKEDGIIGEVFDMKAVREKYEAYFGKQL